jgi:seryl-tRNA synthetase
MLTINLIREKRDFVIERLKVKNFDALPIVDRIIALDINRREVQTRSDSLLAEMNRISKEIGQLMKEGKKAEAEAAKENTYQLKEEIKTLADKLIVLDGQTS